MPRKMFRRILPDHRKIREHKNLQFLGERLHDPNLWHLNRRSVSLAFAVGLFFAWAPVPFQMALAAIGAFYFGANLPIAVALVWLTNPITMPPLFYFAYLLGAWLLGVEATENEAYFESIGGFVSGMGNVLGPFLFGCLLLGVTCSAAGYFGMQKFWRHHVQKQWNERRQQRSGGQPAGGHAAGMPWDAHRINRAAEQIVTHLGAYLEKLWKTLREKLKTRFGNQP